MACATFWSRNMTDTRLIVQGLTIDYPTARVVDHLSFTRCGVFVLRHKKGLHFLLIQIVYSVYQKKPAATGRGQ